MPYDYDIAKFKEKMSSEVLPSVPAELRPALLEMLVDAYDEGYKQCEEDCRIECGF